MIMTRSTDVDHCGNLIATNRSQFNFGKQRSICLKNKDSATGATGCPEGIWGNRYISHRHPKTRKSKEKEIEALASLSRSRIRPHLRGSRRSGLRLRLRLRRLPIHQRNSSEREMDEPIHQRKALTWTFARRYLPSSFSVASSSSSAVH